MFPFLPLLRTTKAIMNLTKFPRRRCGFTLIEMLVVVAIIAILAAIGFTAVGIGMEKARKLAAQKDAADLVNGIHAYYHDYSHYPDIGSKSGDPILKSDPLLMNILLARGPEGKRHNPKGNKYFNGKAAKGSPGREYAGLLSSGSSIELFDHWRKSKSGQTRHYFVRWDANYDGIVLDPITGKESHQSILVWSTGRDGEEVRGTENHPKNRDNVYSW